VLQLVLCCMSCCKETSFIETSLVIQRNSIEHNFVIFLRVTKPGANATNIARLWWMRAKWESQRDRLDQA